MDNYRLLLLLSSLFCSSFGQRAALIASGIGGGVGAEFDFALPNTQNAICNQACPTFYSLQDGYLNGVYQFRIFQVVELDPTGLPCCSFPGCGANPACNEHGVYNVMDVFNQTSVSSKQVVYSGYLDYELSITQRACTAADARPVCALFALNYTIFDQAGTIPINDQTFAVRQESLLAELTISNWNFAFANSGLRVSVLLSVSNDNPITFVINPGAISISASNPSPPIQTGFDTVTLLDYFKREGAVFDSIQCLSHSLKLSFAHYARLDGAKTAIPINITGPYPSISNGGAYFNLDIARPVNGMKIYINAYLPLLTGNPSDIVPGGNQGSTLYPLFGFLALMILIFANGEL